MKKNKSMIPTFKMPGRTTSTDGRLQERKSQNVRTSNVTSMKKLSSIGRISLGTRKPSPVKLPGSSQNRVSNFPLLPSAIRQQSRSSMRSSRLGLDQKKTPWQLGNSSFKTQCIDQVFNYLCCHQSSLNRNVLKGPTNKDFAEIFTTIYRQLDPSFTGTHLEDEIPIILKSLGYPFQMPKSTFLSVGSPHSWPSVLAMLAWLVSFVESTSNEPIEELIYKTDFEADSNKPMLITKYLALAYENGGDNMEKYTEEYEKELSKTTVDPEEMQEAKNELENCNNKLSQLPSKMDELNAFREICSKLEHDSEGIQQFNKELEQCIESKNESRIALEHQLETLAEEKIEIQQQVKELQSLKEEQNFSAEELRRFKNHATYSENRLMHLHEALTNLKKKKWEQELEIAKIGDKLSKSILKFHAQFRNVCGDSDTFENVLSANIIQENEVQIRSYLSDMLNEARRQTETTCQMSKQLKIKFDELSQPLVSIQNDNKKLTTLIQCCKDEIDAINKKMEHERAHMQEEFDEINKCISAAKQEVPLLDFSQNKLDALQEQYNREEENLRSTLVEGYDKLVQQKKCYESFLNAVEKIDEKYIEKIKSIREKYRKARS